MVRLNITEPDRIYLIFEITIDYEIENETKQPRLPTSIMAIDEKSDDDTMQRCFASF